MEPNRQFGWLLFAARGERSSCDAGRTAEKLLFCSLLLSPAAARLGATATQAACG